MWKRCSNTLHGQRPAGGHDRRRDSRGGGLADGAAPREFAGHTLSMMAFPGAALAALSGWPLASGYFVFCVGGALAIAAGADGVGSRGGAARSRASSRRRRRRAGGGARAGVRLRELLRGRAGGSGNAAVRLVPRDHLRAGAGAAGGGRGGACGARALGRPLLFASVDADVAARGACPFGRCRLAFLVLLAWRWRRRARSRGCCWCSRCS